MYDMPMKLKFNVHYVRPSMRQRVQKATNYRRPGTAASAYINYIDMNSSFGRNECIKSKYICNIKLIMTASQQFETGG